MEPRIADFVEKSIREIQTGLPRGFEIEGSIRFDVSVMTTATKSGGLSVRVLTGNIGKENHVLHRIGFSVANSNKQRSDRKQAMTFLRQFIVELASVADEIDKAGHQEKAISSSRLLPPRLKNRAEKVG